MVTNSADEEDNYDAAGSIDGGGAPTTPPSSSQFYQKDRQRKSAGDSPASIALLSVPPLATAADEEGVTIEVIEEDTETTEDSDDAAPVSGSSDACARRRWSDTLMLPPTSTNNAGPVVLSLKLATDRAQHVTRTGLRCSSVLLEVATIYEGFGQALEKAGAALTHQGVTQLQKSALSWSAAVLQYGKTLRLISQPANSLMKTQDKSLHALKESVAKARATVDQYQNRTEAARQKYKRNVSNSMESNILDETKVDFPVSTGEGAGPTGVAAGPVKQKQRSSSSSLRSSQGTALNQFRRQWTLENGKFKEYELLAAFGLDSMQQFECDRYTVLITSLAKLVVAQKQVWGDVRIHTDATTTPATALAEAESSMSSDAAASSPTPKKHNLVKQLLKTNSNISEDNTGVMDADTLGLPTELGELRDAVRSKISVRVQRMATVRALSAFCEAVAGANAKLGIGLKQVVSNMLSIDRECMQGREAPRIVDLWKTLQSMLEQESKAALSCASSIRTLRADRLDKTVLYGSTKATAERDEVLWKQLCDAARAQSRAELRFRQATAQSAKVRERVKSVESARESATAAASNDSKVNKHVHKSIANMFSILPDGGEQAMKMFAPGARASIAKQSLEEADTKESKGRQLLDAAVENSSRALENYKSHATTLVEKYEQEEKSGWDDVRITVSSFVSELESIRSKRVEESRGVLQSQQVPALVRDLAYLEEWRTKAEEEVLAKREETEAAIALDEYAAPPPLYDDSHDSVQGELDSSARGVSTDEEECYDGTMAEIDAEEADGGEASEVGDGQERSRATTPTNMEENEDDQMDTSVRSRTTSEGSGRWLRNLSGGSASPLHPSKNSEALRAKLSFGLASGKSSDSGIGGIGAGLGFTPIGKKRTGKPDVLTEIFLTYFWPDPVDRSSVPLVIESFACSFRDSSHKVPFQYGRVFLFENRLVFCSWTGKKLNLRWTDVFDLDPVSSFMNSADDTIMVTSRKGEKEEAYVFLGGFPDRKDTLEVLENLRKDASTRAEILEPPTTVEPRTPEKIGQSGGGDVPPDETLQKMDKVLTRHLRNVSIERFYEIVWSEGDGTNEKPLYGPWLEKHCFDIEMGAWDREPTVGPWCGEKYSQKRVVKFKVQRKTHLYIGPPVANVVQTHYCRVEGNDKCVFGMTVEFDGIPYSDTFAVEVRWVARREGENDILVEVGVFVDFKKNTFLKAKIRSGTIEESKYRAVPLLALDPL